MTDTKPVKISGSAMSALSYLARTWSGWGNKATLAINTSVPTAECLHEPVYKITLNPEVLLLNPNRVLNTVTPFRLRQEAVLTGALLHEAGHARHSHWQPGRYGNPMPADYTHGPRHNEEKVRPLVLEFAKCIEEARIEGLIAAEAESIGARGLAWTMRCSALRVLPFSEVNVDPEQAVMDVLCSWVLRAGRQVSTQANLAQAGVLYAVPAWVSDFNALLGEVVNKHIVRTKMRAAGDEDALPFDEPSSDPEQTEVMGLLLEAVCAGTNMDRPGSTWLVDKAKQILDILFPPEKQDDLDTQGGCPEDMEQEPGQEDQSEDESDEQGADEAEDQDEESDAGDGDSSDEPDDKDTGGTSDEDGEDGEGDTEPEDEGSGSDPGAGDTGDDEAEPSQADLDAQAELQERLAEVEQAVSKQAEDEKTAEVRAPSEMMSGESADQTDAPGDPGGASGGKGPGQQAIYYRQPNADERDMKKNAVSFLRNIIDPSESGKVQITDSPSAMVDGAALAAWKAGGQSSDPRFFRRIRRSDQPAPPVKIAILVDVSASMDVLQAPSALLSWALSSACLDLRNFAGRGIQVESTLIHWGSSARVIQANGRTMPGIHEGECNESTVAMDSALDLVAEQLPGFFEPPTRPENRLLVQFTDWELATFYGGTGLQGTIDRIGAALTSGVNMLSVVPMDYSWRRTKLDDVVRAVRNPVGRNAMLKYNPAQPQEVWSAASEILSGTENSNYGF